MKILPGIKRIFRIGAFRPDPDGDLEAELSFHFHQTEEELIGEGLSPSEAREEARRRFGNLGDYRRDLRKIGRKQAARSRRVAFLDAAFQDLAHVVRGLKREPGFTTAVVLTLALGIGANATMFGVVDHLLLSPPAHVEHPADVARLQVHRLSPFTGQPETMAYQTYADYRDLVGASTLESVAAFGDQEFVLGRGEEATRVNALLSTASFFPLLGVRPALGRFFDETEDEPGAQGVVVLGHSLWQSRFGGREDVLGESLPIGNESYTVIGVAPRGFNGIGLSPVELFLPHHAFTQLIGTDRWLESRGYYWMQAIARLSPTSTRQAASDEATALHLNGRREYIDQDRYPADARIILGSVKAALGPDAPGEIQVSRWLVGVTLIVLLIACANVANLLLARGTRRRRELGVRVALGIPRRRMLGQHLLESTLLACLGGVVALGIAYWGGRIVRTTLLPDVAWPPSPVDTRVLLFTLAAAVGTGILAGMAPAWKGARAGVVDALKEGGRGGTQRRARSQDALLVAQAALSVILLIGAGLFVRSLHRARTVELGFNPEGLVLASMELEGEWEREARLDLAQRAVERLRSLPGVVEASFATNNPFWGMTAFDFFVPGMDSIPVRRGLGPFVTAGSPEHLSTLGIRLLQGRMYSSQEAAAGARVAVITENMARGLWPNESSLGKCFTLNDPDSPCWEVIGVVESNRLTNITDEIPWQYYLPLGAAEPSVEMDPSSLFVRVQGDPRPFLATVRRELRDLDPGVRFAHVQLQQDLIDPHLRSWRLGAIMFSLFGVLAVLVAMVGLYSVLAFNVTRRFRELGVRSALGASRSRLLNMVLRQAVGVTGVGVLLGLAMALISADRMGSLLFSTSPRDPAVMIGAVVILLAVALAAGAIPAWAAARVEPMRALRED